MNKNRMPPGQSGLWGGSSGGGGAGDGGGGWGSRNVDWSSRNLRLAWLLLHPVLKTAPLVPCQQFWMCVDLGSRRSAHGPWMPRPAPPPPPQHI